MRKKETSQRRTKMRSCRRVKKHAKKYNRTNARLPSGRQRNTGAENRSETRPGGKWRSAAPESQRGSEFSMESANDKIRAHPFRHTKFQNVSARLRSSYSGRVPPFLAATLRPLPPPPAQRAQATWNVVRGIYPSSSSSRYLIFMKDSGS